MYNKAIEKKPGIREKPSRSHRNKRKLGVVVHAFNPIIQETEAGLEVCEWQAGLV